MTFENTNSNIKKTFFIILLSTKFSVFKYFKFKTLTIPVNTVNTDMIIRGNGKAVVYLGLWHP